MSKARRKCKYSSMGCKFHNFDSKMDAHESDVNLHFDIILNHSEKQQKELVETRNKVKELENRSSLRRDEARMNDCIQLKNNECDVNIIHKFDEELLNLALRYDIKENIPKTSRLIIEKVLLEPEHVLYYAKLCKLFDKVSAGLPRKNRKRFSENLFAECQETFQKNIEICLTYSRPYKHRLLEIIKFVAELFNQHIIPVNVLCDYLEELIEEENELLLEYFCYFCELLRPLRTIEERVMADIISEVKEIIRRPVISSRLCRLLKEAILNIKKKPLKTTVEKDLNKEGLVAEDSLLQNSGAILEDNHCSQLENGFSNRQSNSKKIPMVHLQIWMDQWLGHCVEDTLWDLSDLIVEQVIKEPGLANEYSKLIWCLGGLKTPRTNNENCFIMFWQCLLTKCQEAFINKVEVFSEDSNQDKKNDILAVVQFVGELFNERVLNVTGLEDCLTRLLEEDNEDLVECSFCLLKTAGKSLKELTISQKKRMTKFYMRFQEILKNTAQGSRLHTLLIEALELLRFVYPRIEGQALNAKRSAKKKTDRVEPVKQISNEESSHVTRNQPQADDTNEVVEELEKLLKHQLKLDTENNLFEASELILGKVMNEPDLARPCAKLCKRLAAKVKVPQRKSENRFTNLRKCLLTVCRQTFLENIDICLAVVWKQTDSFRFFGIIRFIGELFNQDVITISVLRNYLEVLLGSEKLINFLHFLCETIDLSAVGSQKKIERQNQNIDEYCMKIEKILKKTSPDSINYIGLTKILELLRLKIAKK